MGEYQKKQVDLNTCDREPIHLAANIQPHGFLLIIDKKTLIIEQASENTSQFLGIGIDELSGKSVHTIIPPDDYSFNEQLQVRDAPFILLLSINDRPFVSFIHESAGKVVLECEPYQPLPQNEVVDSGSWLSAILTKFNQLISVEEVSALVAEAVQSVLDFDRVIVFKFDPDWHAEVIGEKIKPGVHSFQGHHFPASDIPAPARALLEIKHIRHIPEVKIQPVPITPYLNPATEKPTDILQSELRYPSEIHLEYLRNMGVSSSISFSVMVKGRLWGLISCTSERPVFVSFHKRHLSGQVVKAYANTLISSEEKRDFIQLQEYKQLEKELMKKLTEGRDLCRGLLGEELNLLSITEASGAAIVLDHQVSLLGLTPDEEQVKEIVSWLSENVNENEFHTRELSASIKNAATYRSKACGLLALEISRFNGEYILYFKPEIKEKRTWAGNPEKPAAGKDARIHPRKSFERWEEMVKGKSLPWSLNELEITRNLLKDLVTVRLRNQNQSLEDLNEEYQTTAEGLRLRNKQLEDFNRIITHNLRAPLSNVQGLYAIYKGNPEQTDAGMFLEKIKVASDNMLNTIEDLHVILKTGTAQPPEPEMVNLEVLVEKELHNMDATISQTGAEINIMLSVPEINSHKVYLESIIHNLISNALKYASPERKPLITVKSWTEEKDFYFSVSDNGVGIDLEKHGHKIFGIYQTFHRKENARGVGLYLTKMQVESLGGSINVKSEPGKGTTFVVNLEKGKIIR